MAKIWFIRQEGKVFGPYGSELIREMAINGNIAPESEISENSQGPWFSIAKLKGVQFAAPPPPPPKSGLPLQHGEPHGRPSNPVQLIEQTGKKIKLALLISVFSAFGGLLVATFGGLNGSSFVFVLGGVIFVFGFVAFVIAGTLAYWHHG